MRAHEKSIATESFFSPNQGNEWKFNWLQGVGYKNINRCIPKNIKLKSMKHLLKPEINYLCICLSLCFDRE